MYAFQRSKSHVHVKCRGSEVHVWNNIFIHMIHKRTVRPLEATDPAASENRKAETHLAAAIPQ